MAVSSGTRPIGFSTGALAHGDFRRALAMLAPTAAPVVELSALRDHELPELMSALSELDLSAYRYVSVHAPSRFTEDNELRVVELLSPCVDRKLPVVIHPDAIFRTDRWKHFGELLCLENMDNRKRLGRTMDEMVPFFERLPDARFCLDLAHARQVDGTMTVARRLLRAFGDRLAQIHLSEIDIAGKHYGLSAASVRSTSRVAKLIPEPTPIILESQVPPEQIRKEIEWAQRALTPRQPTAVHQEACFAAVD